MLYKNTSEVNMKYVLSILITGILFAIQFFVAPVAAAPVTDIVVIDVRTPEEYSESHVKGSQNIDIRNSNFEGQIDRLDKSKTYKLYCRSGNRSGKALDLMRTKGFQNLENLGSLSEALKKLNAECEGLKAC
jgi:rhodanese-related sulfurtransferase